MSDTVLIEEEKDIEHIATRKVAVIRKKMMAAFCVMAGIAILIIAVTTGFYELKFRALAAGLYNIDEKSGEYLIDMMFYNRYSLSDVSKYKNVVKECGYTENGASYMYYRSGQWIIAVAGIIIIAVVMAACIRMIVKIGHNDIYSYVINLDTENQQLKKKQKADERFLVERNEKLQNFTENIAHQIKTPISAIDVLLQAENEPDKIDLKELKRQLFNIDFYVDAVMNYLRLEDMSSDYVFEDCQVEKIVRKAVKKFAAQFIGKKISIELNNLDTNVKTDEKWLGFIIEQLISNAVKYTRNGGKISIYMKETFNSADRILVIEDNGIGITKEDIPRIFERGYTGYNGRMSKKSSGIGLYLCRKAADKLGISIAIESKLDKGTKVLLDMTQKYISHE